MKLYARIKNEKGKIQSLGGNERLDIEIMIGNDMLTSIRIEKSNWGYRAVNDAGIVVGFIEDKKKSQTTQSK